MTRRGEFLPWFRRRDAGSGIRIDPLQFHQSAHKPEPMRTKVWRGVDVRPSICEFSFSRSAGGARKWEFAESFCIIARACMNPESMRIGKCGTRPTYDFKTSNSLFPVPPAARENGNSHSAPAAPPNVREPKPMRISMRGAQSNVRTSNCEFPFPLAAGGTRN